MLSIKSLKLGCLFCIACFCFSTTRLPAQTGKPVDSMERTPDQLLSELEKVVLDEMKAGDIPGAAIGIVSGDRILLAKGFGVASVETGVPVTADTLFRLGSTTKMFTAAALVQMALDGKIDFHKPIGQYVKGLDPTIARCVGPVVEPHGGASER